jgi:hypothetical protein
MSDDQFTHRLAKVRHRFVSALESKIEDAYAAMPKLSGPDSVTVEAVDATYRGMHGIVGVGPTVGFPATGQAARSAELALFAAQHEKRGLAPPEIAMLSKALLGLREAATRELQLYYSGLR